MLEADKHSKAPIRVSSSAVQVTGVVVKASSSLQGRTSLWQGLQQALDGRVVCAHAAAAEASLINDVGTPWAYLESDFHYVPHRQLSAAGAAAAAIAGPGAVGTRFPLVLLFADPGDAEDVESLVAQFAKQLRSPLSPFRTSRVLLLMLGKKMLSLKPGGAASFASCLIDHGVGTVELRDIAHISEYIAQCASAIAESRKRRVPSRFKVAGARCQTLPSGPGEKMRVAWVSQLMQIPGVSEEIAKVIADQYASPAALLQAIGQVDPVGTEAGGQAGGLADSFLAELEFPIRGKKSMRRVGPVVSRRIFTMFNPAVSAQQVLF